MKHIEIPRNFIYPEIKPEHYRFGADNAGPVLREDGDWRDFLPEEEEQDVNDVEPSDCYIEAQQHSIATILEEKYGIKDSNFGAWFNALLSNGTEYGGDPLKGADSIRGDGLIPESMRIWDEIKTWDDFHSWRGANKDLCIAAGQSFKNKWQVNNFIVFEKDEPVEIKYKKLREALKRSPVSMSVYAWDLAESGYYVKPEGANDTHLVTVVYLDSENRATIRDTYKPFTKVLEPFFNSDFAMRHTVEKKVEARKETFWEMIQSILKKLVDKDYRMFGAARSSRWPMARAQFLSMPGNKACAICGRDKNLNVHHKKPFHLHPELELDPTNFVTLCESAGMNCHITFGHLGNFKSVNTSIDGDIKIWHEKVKNRL